MRLVDGLSTPTTRDRRRCARSRLAAALAKRARDGRPRAVARHPGLRPHGRRADDLHEGVVRRFPAARSTQRRCSARRASIKTAQEIERIRLANEIAAAAMDHVRGVIRAGMTEAQIAAEWLGFVHGEGTGWAGKVDLALGFSLVWAGRGIKTFTATTEPARRRGRADAVRDLGLRRRLLGDHTKNVVVGELTDEYAELERGAAGGLRRGRRVLRPGREPRRARSADPRGHRADRLPGPAVASDLPRRRRARARAALRAPGRRRRGPGGHGACNRARMLLRSEAAGFALEDNFLIDADGPEKLCPVPRRDRAGVRPR